MMSTEQKDHTRRNVVGGLMAALAIAYTAYNIREDIPKPKKIRATQTQSLDSTAQNLITDGYQNWLTGAKEAFDQSMLAYHYADPSQKPQIVAAYKAEAERERRLIIKATIGGTDIKLIPSIGKMLQTIGVASNEQEPIVFNKVFDHMNTIMSELQLQMLARLPIARDQSEQQDIATAFADLARAVTPLPNGTISSIAKPIGTDVVARPKIPAVKI